MPDFGITEALALASIISGAAGVGTGIYSAVSSAGNASAQADAAKSAQQAAAQQAANQKQQALKAQIGNAQEQTGGALGDQGLSNFVSLLAGYGGQAGGATSTPTGNATTSSAPSTPGLQDAFSQLSSSTPFSGGSAPAQPGGDSRFQLTQPFF